MSLGTPPLTYKGPAPPRNCVDLLSGLEGVAPPKSGRPPLLDLGSGPADAKTALEWMGYDWVGVDLPPAKPLVFADAHALPFESECFGAAFSLAVLEHLHSPFLALAEVQRVLAPGAPFVGVAAFGEPFHASYFHMSHWGLVSLLHACGFKVTTIWPCRDSLGALAGMGGYPRVIRSLLTALGHLARVPFLSPRRWVRGDGGRARLSVAGSLGFVALKA